MTIAPQATAVSDGPSIDLRRRRGRELAERILDRCGWLAPEDRALIEAVYRDGRTAREIAALTGRDARSVRRRIRSVASRVAGDRYAFVLRERDNWPPTRRRVGTACVLQGRTMRGAAKHLRLSLHAVRRHMDAINALFEASR